MWHSTTLDRRVVPVARLRGAPQAAGRRSEADPVPEPAADGLLLRTPPLAPDPGVRRRMRAGPGLAP